MHMSVAGATTPMQSGSQALATPDLPVDPRDALLGLPIQRRLPEPLVRAVYADNVEARSMRQLVHPHTLAFLLEVAKAAESLEGDMNYDPSTVRRAMSMPATTPSEELERVHACTSAPDLMRVILSLTRFLLDAYSRCASTSGIGDFARQLGRLYAMQAGRAGASRYQGVFAARGD